MKKKMDRWPIFNTKSTMMVIISLRAKMKNNSNNEDNCNKFKPGGGRVAASESERRRQV